MANILYRETTTPTLPSSTSAKGTPLTNLELDANFRSLNDAKLEGIVPVVNGGTGVVTIPANAVVIGAGTDPITSVSPGTAGNVLTSNGTTWSSTAPGGVTTGKAIAMAIVFGS
jgi:hypothetical protein